MIVCFRLSSGKVIFKDFSRLDVLRLFLPALPICHVYAYLCVCSQGAAAYPENEDQQQRLREAAEGLRVATNAAAQNAIKKKLINRLEVSRAKLAVARRPK